MNYNTRLIKPYHPPTNQQHSIYRPAYHRIPSTPIRQSPFLSTELTPIVVPSMSSPNYQPRNQHNYYYNNRINTLPPQQPPATTINNSNTTIIHQTLENATITFDTTEPGFQKDLVKDVFFSPAVMVPSVREMSPSLSSTSSCSLDEPFETPLFEENLFGLDLSCFEKKKPTTTLNLSTLTSFDMKHDLPTPPADNVSLKRQCPSSEIQSIKKKQRPATPPIDYFDQLPSALSSSIDSDFWESEEEEEEEEEEYVPKIHKKLLEPAVQESHDHLPKAAPRPTAYPTIYQKLTKANIDWCRYCGTTEGVNWRPGPWGKRTLCNKHGCDYKGYGFACKLPRLDLTGFTKESIHDRERPVLQLFCSGCQHKESWEGNVLVRCEGCPKAYHQNCCPQEIDEATVNSNEPWFCDEECRENSRRKRIVVELSRKRLPLMRSPSRNSSV